MINIYKINDEEFWLSKLPFYLIVQKGFFPMLEKITGNNTPPEQPVVPWPNSEQINVPYYVHI